VEPAAVPLLRPFGVLEDVPALGLVLALVVGALPVVDGDEFVVAVGSVLMAPLFCARPPLPDEVDAVLPAVPQGLLIPA
jgi:hypothetical protein